MGAGSRRDVCPHPESVPVGLIATATIPVFALIGLGYLCGARRIMGPAAVEALNLFVMYLALPALIFRSVADTPFGTLANGHYLLAFGGGVLVAFAVSFVIDRVRRRDLTTTSIQALASSYPNAGFMGVPLAVAVIGEESLPPIAVSAVITVCVLMAASIIVIEFDRPDQVPPAILLRGVFGSLAKNPLLVAPVIGAAWSLLARGQALPGAVDTTLSMLGAASSPCALVTIGLFLSHQRGGGDARTVARIIGLKLLVQPAVTAFLVLAVFPTTTVWAHTAILLSALPVGTGPFMLAKLYERDAAVASQVILLSTMLSLVTVSAVILLFSS